jgi:hypothetical protein
MHDIDMKAQRTTRSAARLERNQHVAEAEMEAMLARLIPPRRPLASRARHGRWRTRLQRILAVRQRGRWHPNVLTREIDLRAAARDVHQRAYPGTRVVEVHHRIPLEWRFHFPDANPNRLANLQGLTRADHRRKATDMWDAFRNTYRRRGLEPNPADVLAHAMLVDQSLNLPRHLP